MDGVVDGFGWLGLFEGNKGGKERCDVGKGCVLEAVELTGLGKRGGNCGKGIAPAPGIEPGPPG